MESQIITGSAKLAGVVGYPVKHSLSPVLHNYWLRRGGIDGVYIPLQVKPQDFTSVMSALHKANFCGVNITIPHKETAYHFVDECDLAAQMTGSVNTIIFKDDGKVFGTSTDGDGFVASLEDASVSLNAKTRVCLLGAGGAARSVAVALAKKNVHLTIVNRHKERADQLVLLLKERFEHINVLPWESWTEALGGYDLLVNTTSLGMAGGPDPAYAPSLAAASPGLVVADCVYRPLLTPLLAEAQKRKLKTVGGLGMLLHQAGFGFHAWFGHQPVIDADTYNYVHAFL